MIFCVFAPIFWCVNDMIMIIMINIFTGAWPGDIIAIATVTCILMLIKFKCHYTPYSFTDNDLTATGAITLASALHQNKALEELE